MAIHPTDVAPQAPAIDIEAWTEEATAAMSTVTVSAPVEPVALPFHPASVTLQIPLDGQTDARLAPAATAKEGAHSVTYKRKEPLRRDSMKRREALLKGNEGSRRRQRWENDHLLSNPHATPPLPSDWQIRPTHPTHNVPYYLAPLWDSGLSSQNHARITASKASKVRTRTVSRQPVDAGIVPREVREKIKRARGTKGLLTDLETEIRGFASRWVEREREAEEDGLPADLDSSDDEIVFVGRNGVMKDMDRDRHMERREGKGESDVGREMMLFETAEADQGGKFGRWLVHHLGTYYGLRTWSVTVGDPARREAYVGVKEVRMRTGGQGGVCSPLPRPLYGLV